MNFAMCSLLLTACLLAATDAPTWAPNSTGGSGSTDNGIHVGQPKVYDSRELTLMLDGLSESLRGKQFVDPAALAKALGNTQGYRNTDFSQSVFANGAVGPQAASVFAGTLGSDSSTPASSDTSSTASAPAVTINVSPTQNAGGTTSASTSGSSGLGPQAPALPTLQTAPTYAPTFGPNGSDTLSDEVNLTYQLYNIRMLLSRSLTDRLHNQDSRLQAVLGFDIDIEQDKTLADSAAIVEVTPRMTDVPSGCENSVPNVVALMPEEGSHNAATLNQKANAFGGAIAASVFSVGYSGQKRSQVFYLYRDMDTLSLQKLAADGALQYFGWQFRPVLGKRSVDPGLRHMIVVLSLPCSDTGNVQPKIDLSVKTRWVRYESKTQTTVSTRHFWQSAMPKDVATTFSGVEVPSTNSFQDRLKPKVTGVTWFPSEDSSGIAVVKGDNFFPGTTVRLGSKVFHSSAEGLTIKSDKELEVVVPLSLAAIGGVISGRYGDAVALANPANADDKPGCALQITFLKAYPAGSDMFQVVSDIEASDEKTCGHRITAANFNAQINAPIAIVNGAPVASRPIFMKDASANSGLEFATLLPADVVHKMTSFEIAVPFASRYWSARSPFTEVGLEIKRLGTPSTTVLIVSSTSYAVDLCGGFTPQLTPLKTYPVGALSNGLGAECADKKSNNVVRLSIDSKDLKGVHRLMFVRKDGQSPPLTVDIPKDDSTSTKPSLDKNQKITLAQYDVRTVTFTGKNLGDITKVYFDKIELRIVDQEDKKIVLSIPAIVTAKPRATAELQFQSDGNDPLIGLITVTPNTKGH